MYFSLSQSEQIPALEARMALTGIRLRSALLNLWVLIQLCEESDFPLAAHRDIFNLTVALLLKYETAQKKTSLILSFFFLSVDIHISMSHTHRLLAPQS